MKEECTSLPAVDCCVTLYRAQDGYPLDETFHLPSKCTSSQAVKRGGVSDAGTKCRPRSGSFHVKCKLCLAQLKDDICHVLRFMVGGNVPRGFRTLYYSDHGSEEFELVFVLHP
jgi:hypothetical protein